MPLILTTRDVFVGLAFFGQEQVSKEAAKHHHPTVLAPMCGLFGADIWIPFEKAVPKNPEGFPRGQEIKGHPERCETNGWVL